ncbi:transcriptional regulator [Psychrobacillus sp. INOP01]|uniref:transcriptional regulator n=1 Tax=Psychrobacillus sp. INOP01 TaxID=2829187 RepID=UPI001BA965C7|nr:transcriptional regulator [Psychrobacillus sp. INOP01]QUG41230.1 transcriptional regulator [Psychrobacillus sp. INOP01]
MRKNILKSMQQNQIVEMIYMKDNGEISKRKFVNVSNDSFQAYCFLRGTMRTFKIENVLASVPIIQKEREVV